MVFKITEPKATEVPIVVSVPHCGTAFPDELRDQYRQDLIQAPDDTDWFVDKLYDFVPHLGITLISAHYSRWVIDLNRDPQSKPLYNDGRIITALCPSTDFLGTPLYLDNRKEVEQKDVSARLDKYFWPYHHQLSQLIAEKKKKFGKVLLWDCHSIKQIVPTIQKEKFPDLILGDADETSASKELIDTAWKALNTGTYGVNHNHPFKGGFITRNFGKPSEQQHALQLEMSKVHYMDDAEKKYDATRADKMRYVLKQVFEGLIQVLGK